MEPPDAAPDWPPPPTAEPLAVLASGGLDSAVLLGEACRSFAAVVPLYVRCGSAWDDLELAALTRFAAELGDPNLRPVVTLSVPTADLYGAHWSLSGTDVPDARSPDEAVYLPGRNVLLFGKALVWCHLNGVPALATAPLAANPFPDATDAFFDEYARIVSASLNGGVRVLRPYARLSKSDVIRRGAGMPLGHTFSCLSPRAGAPCGACNKCAERQSAFLAAGVPDPTEYATTHRSVPCSA